MRNSAPIIQEVRISGETSPKGNTHKNGRLDCRSHVTAGRDTAHVVDSLLKSLNPPEKEIDQKWAAVAKGRLREIRSGTIKTIPGNEVFAEISKS